MSGNGNMSAGNCITEGPEGDTPSLLCPKLRSVSLELRTVLVYTFGISLVTTAFPPLEALQSSLNSDARLGTLSLVFLYVPYFIVATMAPLVVRLLTPKWTVIVACACDGVYVGANFYPSWWTLIPAAALIGTISGPTWTAKDLYISQMARQSVDATAEDFDKNYQAALSFYNGIVFAGFSTAAILGQLISSAILTQSSVSAVSSVCGAFYCPGDVKVVNNITNQTTSTTPPERSLVYLLCGVLLSLVVTGIVFMAALLRQIPFGSQNISFRKTVTSCARHVIDVPMLLLIPQIVLCGFYLSFIQADYTKSYITCGAGIGTVGYIIMSKGVSETLASVTCGRTIKYTGRPIQVCAALLGYLSVTVMLWLWIPSGSHLASYFVIPVVLGACDVIFNIHICTLLALLFKDDRAAAFANFYVFRSLSKAVSFGLSGFVCVWIKLTIASVLLAIASVSFVVLERMVKRRVTPTEDTA